MRFVPKKAVIQQETQGLHRARQRVVNHRVALISQMRGQRICCMCPQFRQHRVAIPDIYNLATLHLIIKRRIMCIVKGAFAAFILGLFPLTAVAAGSVNCTLQPLAGTPASRIQNERTAWRIKPELPASGDFPWYAPAKSPQLYQFDCSDNPKGKPLSGVSPNIPVLQLNRK